MRSANYNYAFKEILKCGMFRLKMGLMQFDFLNEK